MVSSSGMPNSSLIELETERVACVSASSDSRSRNTRVETKVRSSVATAKYPMNPGAVLAIGATSVSSRSRRSGMSPVEMVPLLVRWCTAHLLGDGDWPAPVSRSVYAPPNGQRQAERPRRESRPVPTAVRDERASASGVPPLTDPGPRRHLRWTPERCPRREAIGRFGRPAPGNNPAWPVRRLQASGGLGLDIRGERREWSFDARRPKA